MPYNSFIDRRCISTWAPELLLETFQWFPVGSLIAAQGVNRQWRRLVPLADIPPMRRALLDLYIEFLESPAFLPSRPAILDDLRPFDREGYVALLHDNGLRLPEEFLLWIREWPSKAVIDGSWPGLPSSTVNCLPDALRMIKEIKIIKFPFKKISDEKRERSIEEEHLQPRKAEMQALEIATDNFLPSWWLILDGPRKDLMGNLYLLQHDAVHEDDLSPFTWVEWLRGRIEAMEDTLVKYGTTDLQHTRTEDPISCLRSITDIPEDLILWANFTEGYPSNFMA